MLAMGMGLGRSARRRGWNGDALARVARVETAGGAPPGPKVKLAIDRLVHPLPGVDLFLDAPEGRRLAASLPLSCQLPEPWAAPAPEEG